MNQIHATNCIHNEKYNDPTRNRPEHESRHQDRERLSRHLSNRGHLRPYLARRSRPRTNGSGQSKGENYDRGRKSKVNGRPYGDTSVSREYSRSPAYGIAQTGKPTATGWDPQRVARAWAVLMNRLGYTRYVAQGGDWGNAVTEQMALQQPAGLTGILTNMPATVPSEISKAMAAGSPPPATLSADERNAWDQLDFFYKTGLGYANEMALRPQTLYGIADSPVGLAAWMLDHDARSYSLIARVFDGKPEGLSRDDILDNITMYWLTNT